MIRFPLQTSRVACTGLLAIALASTAPAQASAERAAERARDSRLASRDYNAAEVVRINGQVGVQASIAFGEDEHIENVAIGDSSNWQVTPNKRANLLFVKPLEAHARTNLTVVTDRRYYYFDLVASPSLKPIYVLRFTYPEDEKKKAAAAQTAANALNSAEAQAMEAPVTDPADLNFAWNAKGKSSLLPSRIYDDGQATYARWEAGRPVPAILVRNPKGEEGPVNYAVRGDVIVIDGVPDVIILRSGRDSATLENQGEPRKPAQSDASAQFADAGSKEQ